MAGGLNIGKQGTLASSCAPGPSPTLLLPLSGLRKVMRKRQGSKSQQQERRWQQQQQQLFPSPINTLHYQARREGWEGAWGGQEGGEAATCVAEIKAMRWCQTPHH